jgi:hypothetical protein
MAEHAHGIVLLKVAERAAREKTDASLVSQQWVLRQV